MVDEVKPVYVPTLKWRQGEKLALKNLPDRLKSSIIPLIELVNDEGDNPEDLSNDLSTFWSKTAYLDVHYRPQRFARPALNNVTSHNQNIDIIPVVRLDSPQIVIEGVKNVAGIYNNGFALRIIANQDIDFSLLSEDVRLMLERLAGSKDKVDLIVDFGYLEAETQLYQTTLENIANSISLNDWRRVIVAAGSFPPSLNDFRPNEDNLLKRIELELWQKNQSKHGRELIYSDYTVRNPDNIVKGFSRGSVSVRYTLENDFQIFRGTREDKSFKYLVHAMNIKALYSDKYPENYCWGDEMIVEKANQLEKCLSDGADPEAYDGFLPGGAKDWVALSINHHMTIVLKSNLQV